MPRSVDHDRHSACAVARPDSQARPAMLLARDAFLNVFGRLTERGTLCLIKGSQVDCDVSGSSILGWLTERIACIYRSDNGTRRLIDLSIPNARFFLLFPQHQEPLGRIWKPQATCRRTVVSHATECRAFLDVIHRNAVQVHSGP